MKTQRDGYLQARKKESDRIHHSPGENQHSRHLGLRLNLQNCGEISFYYLNRPICGASVTAALED